MMVCVGYFVFISYSKLVEKNWMARKYVGKIGPISWVILPPSHLNLVTVTSLNLQISWNWLENWHFETWQTEILDTKELAVCIVCRSRQLMPSLGSVQDYLLKSHFAWKLFLVAAVLTWSSLNFSNSRYSSSSIQGPLNIWTEHSNWGGTQKPL